MSPELASDDLGILPLWQAVPDGLVAVDRHGMILAVNDRFAALVDEAAANIIGRSVNEFVPAASRASHQGLVVGFFEDPVNRSMAAGGRLAVERSDGTTVPVAVSLSSIVLNGAPAVLAAVRDVTDAVVADQQLAESTRRRLLVELRDRLGRDLHDTVIQELFAVGMSLQSVVSHIDDPLVAERVGASIDQLDGVIRHIRDAVLGPRDHSDPHGLSWRLVAVAAELTPALGFPPQVRIASDLDDRVPPEVAAHVIPVLREALANVARHADAVDVDIDVHIDDGYVVVRVADDGVGPPPRVLRPGGLANLASRAEEVGGSFELTAHRPAGSVLVWKAPVD
jgi:PAS domain S-box-containing protein